MKTQCSPAVGQPLFAGNTQKKPLSAIVKGMIGGLALSGVIIGAPKVYDTFISSKNVQDAHVHSDPAAEKQAVLVQMVGELGDSMVGLMLAIHTLAEADNIQGLDLMKAAITASKNAGKALNGLDLNKAFSKVEMEKMANYIKTAMAQSEVFDRVIAENPAFAQKLEQTANNPESELAQAGERLGHILPALPLIDAFLQNADQGVLISSPVALPLLPKVFRI